MSLSKADRLIMRINNKINEIFIDSNRQFIEELENEKDITQTNFIRGVIAGNEIIKNAVDILIEDYLRSDEE